MKDYIVKFELNDTTYELPFSADVNSSTVLKQWPSNGLKTM